MTKKRTKILEIHPGAKPVVTRKTVEVDNFRAEFFVNNQIDPPVYHFVVMRKGSVEILAWGQERSEIEAERAARQCIDNLSRRTSAAG